MQNPAEVVQQTTADIIGLRADVMELLLAVPESRPGILAAIPRCASRDFRRADWCRIGLLRRGTLQPQINALARMMKRNA